MNCPSGKRIYYEEHDAEEALIGAHIAYQYGHASGPLNFYKCDQCGHYHLTSRPPKNNKLSELEASGELERMREARNWEQSFKFKRK